MPKGLVFSFLFFSFLALPCVLQYMVVYQLLVSLAVNTAFFMDGSWLSVTQVSS